MQLKLSEKIETTLMIEHECYKEFSIVICKSCNDSPFASNDSQLTAKLVLPIFRRIYFKFHFQIKQHIVNLDTTESIP